MKTLALLLLLSTTLLFAQSPEVEITSEPSHHLALENAYVRVFKVEAPPHASTLVHWHRHDYMYVTLGDSYIENDVKGKPPVTLKFKDGETHYSPATFAHAAKNLADTPFRNVTIEFLKNDDSKWDPDRGLSILHGGTIDILFVKDGARVSDIDLQPGGIIPEHTHTGPHLLVAVTDVDLEAKAAGKPATHLQLKAGDIKWIEGGITHTVINAGKQEARMITVEFK
jgi:quercetin dioxygenase-like cupin family protein